VPEGVSITRLDNGNGRKKERCVVVDTSMPMPGIVYTHNNSLGNLVRALGERLYKVPHGDDLSILLVQLHSTAGIMPTELFLRCRALTLL
jgi:hypothetical protein